MKKWLDRIIEAASLPADAEGVERTAVLWSRCRRRRDEQGTALVEFALVVTLLVTLLLGIVVFGILLGKRQVLTQAAAEGARAAVPYQYVPTNTLNLEDAARNQVNKSLQAVDRICGDGNTRCSFKVFPCAETTASPPNGKSDCIEVSVVLDVKTGAKPLAPTVTPISVFLPSTMTSKFTASLANPT